MEAGVRLVKIESRASGLYVLQRKSLLSPLAPFKKYRAEMDSEAFL